MDDGVNLQLLRKASKTASWQEAMQVLLEGGCSAGYARETARSLKGLPNTNRILPGEAGPGEKEGWPDDPEPAESEAGS